MSLLARLYNGSILVDLHDTTSYGIREGSSLESLAHQVVYAEPWKRGYQPLVGTSLLNRTISLVVRVKGTSLDNWVVNYQALAQTLLDTQAYWESVADPKAAPEGARAYLAVQLTGMTSAVEFDVISGTVEAGALFRWTMALHTSAPVLVDVPVTLTVKPLARPQQRTRTTVSLLNNGGGVSAADGTYTLSAPLGNLPAPLRVAYQSAAGDVFQRIILARKVGGALSNFVWGLNCELGAATNYTVTNIEASANFALANVAVATAHGGNVLRLTKSVAAQDTNAPIIQVSITSHVRDFYGKYRVFLRLDAISLAANCSLSLTYGGASGTDIVNTASADLPVTASDFLMDMGTMNIPHRVQPLNSGLSTFDFTIRGTLAATGGTIDFDCIYLVPIDGQLLDVQYNADITAQYQVVSDNLAPNPLTYLLSDTGLVQANATTVKADTRFEAPHQEDSLWLCLILRAGTPNLHDLTDVFGLAFDYYPLYAMVR